MVKSLLQEAENPSASHAETKSPHTTASRALTTLLVRRILAGACRAGERLPTEREMAEQFHVSRHVVREALKRLEALDLVHIQHGSGAYVNDVVLSGGIQLFEYIMYDEEGNIDIKALGDFFAFAAHFVPHVFRLAAIQRTDEELRNLRRLLAERARTLDDLNKLIDNSLRMLQTIARATHNSIFQLVFNNVGHIVVKLRERVPLSALAPVVPQEHLERVVEAIDKRDPEMAALLVLRQAELAEHTVRSFLHMLAAAAATPTPTPVS